MPNSFNLITRVPTIRIIYPKELVKAASRLRDAFRTLTDNDRYRLLILMGDNVKCPADMTFYFIESNGEYANVESPYPHTGTMKDHVKIFTSDDAAQEVMDEIAEMFLSQFL